MRQRKRIKYRPVEDQALSRVDEFEITCPFCGGSLSDWLRSDGKRWVRCDDCGFLAEHIVIELDNQKACSNHLAELQAFGVNDHPKRVIH